jgi:glycosyltransferase involved in cell wall biosynthesis
MPEISVIIPTYQHGETIAACLDSVFKQTIKDIEVIVINDGSADGTDKAIAPFLDRIIYRKTMNSGAPKSRNLGFSLSSGKYVIFLDADIVMKPRMLEELRKALEQHPEASYAYAGFRFGIARFRGERFDAERLRRMNFIHTSALIRRGDFPGFDESLKRFQDWDLWLTLLEKGKVGISVNKILFSAKPRSRFGISQWRPKIFFSPLFAALGIRSEAVDKYRAAAAVIAAKHRLDLFAPVHGEKPWWPWFLGIFALSALCFNRPVASTIASAAALLFAIIAARKRLVYGVGIMLSELIFGSLSGKTLVFGISGATIPFRYVLFAAIGAIWIFLIAKRRVRLPPKSLIIGVMVALAAVGWGIVNGLWQGISLRGIFFDANAYLALPMLLIFVSAVETESDQRFLLRILKQGTIALSLFTIAALFFFSHKFANPYGVYAYKWLRDSRIAEITALSGGIYRIFIQSQLFCLLAFILVAFKEKNDGWKSWVWGILPASALIISGSRSFALGLIAAFFAAMILTLLHRTHTRPSATLPLAQGGGKGEGRIKSAVMRLALFLVVGIGIYAILLFFPLPSPRSQASFQDMLRSRSVSERDAATISRWSLLKALNDKIGEAPILGSGLGATVTYRSSDPRIIASTGGSYTTSAFEWNYHDLIVKMGFIGLAAFIFLLWSILTIVLKTDARRRMWLVPGFFALIALNAVSPYLNHPLGIGYLALLLALSDYRREQLAAATLIVPVKRPMAVAVPAGLSASEK